MYYDIENKKVGICPKCNSDDIDYINNFEHYFDNDYLVFKCKCNNCKGTFKEYNFMEFSHNGDYEDMED